MTKNNNGKNGETNSRQDPGSKMPGQLDYPAMEPVGYEIRVKDHLETYWFEWFEGWSVTNLENGEVLLKSDRSTNPGCMAH